VSIPKTRKREKGKFQKGFFKKQGPGSSPGGGKGTGKGGGTGNKQMRNPEKGERGERGNERQNENDFYQNETLEEGPCDYQRRGEGENGLGSRRGGRKKKG